jgi:hypothetical protein
MSNHPRPKGFRGKFYVVTKSDIGMRVPFVVGSFTCETKARGACVGVGTFAIMHCDPNRVYPQGSLLDVEMIVNLPLGAHKVL